MVDFYLRSYDLITIHSQQDIDDVFSRVALRSLSSFMDQAKRGEPQIMNNTLPKRVGLIEDDQVMRSYLEALLQREGVTSAKGWSSAEDFLESPDRCNLDMLFVDLQLPGESGISLIRRLHAEQPSLRCVVLTASRDLRQVCDSLRYGASGYLSKHCGPDGFLASLACVMQDVVTLSPNIAELLVEEFLRSRSLAEKELERAEALTRLIMAWQRDWLLECLPRA